MKNIEKMCGIRGKFGRVQRANPNFVEIAAKGLVRVSQAAFSGPVASHKLN